MEQHFCILCFVSRLWGVQGGYFPIRPPLWFETTYLLLYVDDIVLIASSPALLCRFIQDLQRQFSMKDLGPIHHILGVHVQHTGGGGLHLFQRQFMIDILDHASMSASKPCSTPIDTNPKLSAATRELLEKQHATDFRSPTGAFST
jgi:hypothetical protein